MRFMMLVMPDGYGSAEPGAMPSAEAVAKMMEYNKSLQEAGVLLALDGLHPLSMGGRLAFRDGKSTVLDGPFTEAKEVLGGYWMIQVRSKEEAMEWAKRCPAIGSGILEVRQVQEFQDFPADVKEAVDKYPEVKAEFEHTGKS